MQNELVSIIVTAYKAEKEIEKCISSVLEQTYKNFELILVDNASPDRVPVIMDNYAEKDSRIVVLHIKNNIGVGDGRNNGIEHALKNENSKYLFFLDADDWIHPECIERLYDLLKKDNSDISFTRHKYVTGFDAFEKIDKETYETEVYDDVEDFWINGINQAAFCTGRLFRKQLFDDVRFPSSGLDDERTTYKAVYKSNRVSIMNKELYFWYQNPASYTHYITKERLADQINSVKEPLDYFYNNHLIKSFHSYKINYYLVLTGRLFRHGWKKPYKDVFIDSIRYIKTLPDKYTPELIGDYTKDVINQLALRYCGEVKKAFKRSEKEYNKPVLSSVYLYLKCAKDLFRTMRYRRKIKKYLK